MVPVELNEDTLDVAFATFEDTLMVDELQLLTNLTIRPMIAPLSVVEKTLETLYRSTRTKFISQLEDYNAEEEEASPEDENLEQHG